MYLCGKDGLTCISVEGGPRSGKGLFRAYLASEAYISGLKVVANEPLGFPRLLKDPNHLYPRGPKSVGALSSAFLNRLYRVFPLVKQRGLKSPVLVPITGIVDPHSFETLWSEGDCFHTRQEFHTEVESSMGGGRTRFRLACLDWALQLGKAQSSLAFDTQQFEAVDKRIRVGMVVQRVWALSPFHKRGEPFEYLVYDRATMSSELIRADEEALSFLYDCYDTLYRAQRDSTP